MKTFTSPGPNGFFARTTVIFYGWGLLFLLTIELGSQLCNAHCSGSPLVFLWFIFSIQGLYTDPPLNAWCCYLKVQWSDIPKYLVPLLFCYDSVYTPCRGFFPISFSILLHLICMVFRNWVFLITEFPSPIHSYMHLIRIWKHIYSIKQTDWYK